MTQKVDDEVILVPAFRVEDTDEEEMESRGPPTSAQEYLRRVQKEAKKCPDIVVAELDLSTFYKKQTVKVSQQNGLSPAPHGFSPSLQWQQEQTAGFSSTRNKLSRFKARQKREGIKHNPNKLPGKEDVAGWCSLCFGRLRPEKLSNESREGASGGGGSDDTGMPPLLSIITCIDQPTLVQVLEYHVNWFEATGFTEQQGRWFYALLACLEKPLDPEMCALLRCLARNCANLRASLENPDDARLVPLNLLICIVARYFDQGDLADR